METLNHIIETLKTTSKDGTEPVLGYDKQREVQIAELNGRYVLRVTPISFGKGYWSYLAVEILDAATKVKLGEYVRNYHSLYKTFTPFTKNGKDYALYSKSYTATRVMSLPDCKDVAGEDPHGAGFCPTEFYVPQPDDGKEDADDEPNPALDGSFGFVAGCHWGDDSSWKAEYLDLSQIENGILKRESRFGYFELPDGCDLKDAINLRWYSEDNRSVSIRTDVRFDLRRSVSLYFSGLVDTEYEKQLNIEDPTRRKKCVNCTHAGEYHSASRANAVRICVICDDVMKGRCDCTNFEPSTETEEI